MPLSTFEFNGREYDFAPERDLNSSNLRHIKQWFPDLGSYAAMVSGLSLADVDALACLLWIARNRAGDAGVPEPTRSADFPIGQLVCSFVMNGKRLDAPMPKVRFTLDETEYLFDPDAQVTCSRLRYIKKRYPEYRSYLMFINAFYAGDPDACACVARIVRIEAGENEKEVEDPRFMDVSPGEIMVSRVVEGAEDDDDDAAEEPLEDEPEPPDPTQEEEVSTTSSPLIPSESGTRTSSPSPTRADSLPRSKPRSRTSSISSTSSS